LVCWCVGALVCWCVGVLVSWRAGVLVCWRVLVCWCAGVLVCWARRAHTSNGLLGAITVAWGCEPSQGQKCDKRTARGGVCPEAGGGPGLGRRAEVLTFELAKENSGSKRSRLTGCSRIKEASCSGFSFKYEQTGVPFSIPAQALAFEQTAGPYLISAGNLVENCRTLAYFRWKARAQETKFGS
jgi:hypothetical protein